MDGFRCYRIGLFAGTAGSVIAMWLLLGYWMWLRHGALFVVSATALGVLWSAWRWHRGRAALEQQQQP